MRRVYDYCNEVKARLDAPVVYVRRIPPLIIHVTDRWPENYHQMV